MKTKIIPFQLMAGWTKSARFPPSKKRMREDAIQRMVAPSLVAWLGVIARGVCHLKRASWGLRSGGSNKVAMIEWRLNVYIYIYEERKGNIDRSPHAKDQLPVPSTSFVLGLLYYGVPHRTVLNRCMMHGKRKCAPYMESGKIIKYY